MNLSPTGYSILADFQGGWTSLPGSRLLSTHPKRAVEVYSIPAGLPSQGNWLSSNDIVSIDATSRMFRFVGKIISSGPFAAPLIPVVSPTQDIQWSLASQLIRGGLNPIIGLYEDIIDFPVIWGRPMISDSIFLHGDFEIYAGGLGNIPYPAKLLTLTNLAPPTVSLQPQRYNGGLNVGTYYAGSVESLSVIPPGNMVIDRSPDFIATHFGTSTPRSAITPDTTNGCFISNPLPISLYPVNGIAPEMMTLWKVWDVQFGGSPDSQPDPNAVTIQYPALLGTMQALSSANTTALSSINASIDDLITVLQQISNKIA